MLTARPARRAPTLTSLLLVMMLLLQLLPAPAASVGAAQAAPPAAQQSCEIYPIGIAAQLLAGKAPGDQLDARMGWQPGGSHWLTWSGSLTMRSLLGSLLPPGDSVTYRNPADPQDRSLNVGDPVRIKPGVLNLASIRGAIEALKAVDIVVPVGQQAAGNLAAPFVVERFIRARIVSYGLIGADKISLRYLGEAGCGAAPAAEPLDVATDEDTSVEVTLRGSHAGDATLVFQLGPAGHGSLSGLSDQACSAQGGVTTCTAAVVYVPDADYHGPDTFSYTVSNGMLASAPADVSLTIRPANDSPTAADDVAAGDEDGAVTIDVLANDRDIDGDSLTASAVGSPAHGTAEFLAGGAVRYTPAPDYSGGDSFGYTLSDGKGGTATAMVQVSIAPINDAPRLVAAPAAVGVSEDGPAQTIVLTGADVESAPGQLAIAVAALPTRGSLTRADGGQVSLADVLPSPVELIYTPAADAHGDDLLRAVVTDGGEGLSAPLSAELTVPISIAPVNDAPTAADRKLTGLRRGVPAQVELIAADVDSASLSLSIVDAPDHGQLGPLGAPQCAPAGAGSSCSATLTYTPDSDFAGADSFSYTSGDGGLTSEPASVSIVTANAPPVADGQAVVADEDTASSIALTASDPDGDALTFAIVAAPAHGAVSISGSAAAYTPAPQYHGPDSFSFRVSDGLADSEVATVTISVAPINDAPVFGPAPTNAAQEIDEGAGLAALTASDVDGDALTFAIEQGSLPAGLSINADGSFSGAAASGSAGSYSVVVVVADGAGASATGSLTVVVNAIAIPLPPDPSSVAPPVDAQATTSVADATAFLYSGPNPIQTGVAPGAIEELRAGVLRGRVVGRDGQPIGGVSVTVKDRPEYGATLTRGDGMFDLAVNGGGSLTISYAKAGLLPVQRTVMVPWQEYVSAPEVVMIQLDGAVTPVELGAGQPLQAARANPVSDADGTRRATLLFPAGVTASMVLADGTQVALTSLHVRATEYTVGARGFETMPAELPANSGYTYAAELSVDEALAAGATEVRFSQPVPFYIENFLAFPVGTVVPAGYYDRQKGQWIGSDNGRVIQILAESNGSASIDIDGSGVAAGPAALAALGVSDAELAQLATLYAPGQSLWRTPIPHFSPWDCNFPWGPPLDSLKPNQQELNGEQESPSDNLPIDDDRRRCGSVIGCMNQTLGEGVAVPGTPYSLYYQSDRTAGYSVGRSLEIPLSGPAVPGSLRAIKLEVSVAGQSFKRTFPAAPNQHYTFMWDGKDGYGRQLQGRQPVSVRVGYDYPLVYYRSNNDLQRAWARVAGATFTPVLSNRQGVSITVWQDWEGQVSTWSTMALGAEGWDLDVHHHYDPMGQTLMMGDGTQRSAVSVDTLVVNTVAGNPAARVLGDGGQALLARVLPRDIEVGPDGSIYIAEIATQRVRKVDPNGIITTIAGNGVTGYSGDGGPAVNARLNFPTGIAVGPDGSVYIADSTNSRIRKVDPNGIITTVAGNGALGTAGDNGPATAAELGRPEDVAVAPDGSLYIADTQTFRIRKVNPDGIIFTIAGTTSVFVDRGPAYSSSVGRVRSLDLGPDGSLYLSGSFERVRQITPDGMISTVAGRGSATSSGDGGPATLANVSGVDDIAINQYNGDLYIAESQRVRRVHNGIITTISGNGERCVLLAQDCAEGALAAGSKLSLPGGLAVGPDGAVYVGENSSGRVRRIATALPHSIAIHLPQTDAGNVLIPSEDGSQAYRFLPNGRHTQTIDALTGAVIFSFAYDAAGQLSSVTDVNGRATTVERDGRGRPTAVVAPNGQRTLLTVSDAGALEQVVAPDGATYVMGYGAGRLLTSFTNPISATSTFTYDADGRLVSDIGPDSAGVSIARTATPDGFRVVLTSTLGRATTYEVERLSTGDQRLTSIGPDGTRTVDLRRVNGLQQTTAADGTVTEVVRGADPRWGMLAPRLQQLTRRSPAGVVLTASTLRSVQLTNSADPFSLASASETLTINGRAETTAYDAATRQMTITSAGGRIARVTFDARGRVTQVQAAGALPISYSYDGLGRLAQIAQGARTWLYTYDQLDHMTQSRDPLGRTASYSYDLAGRITGLTREDGAAVAFSYDANGNLVSVTPAGRQAYAFERTAAGQLAAQTPPSVGGEPERVEYLYSLDREPTQILYADGRQLALGYNDGGRLTSRSLDAATTSLAYSPTSGSLASMTDAGGSLSYAYDGALLTGSAWAGAIAGNVSWAYTPNLQVQSVSVNGADPVAYVYDADRLLTAAGALSLTRSAQTGQIQGSSLGGVSTSLSYDDFGALRTLGAAFGATALYGVQYTRDALDRITGRAETIGGQSATYGYVYDDAGQLTGVTRDGVAVASYAYDANGNRTSATEAGVTVEAAYDAQDRLVQRGATTYTYAADGALLRETTGDQVTSYQYDVAGNLRAVTQPDGTQISYLIDGQNRRIGKRVNGALVQGFLYDGSLRPVAELDGSGAVRSRFVYGGSVNVPEYIVRGGATYRVISDERGSPRLVVNAATGEVAQRMDYDVWGNVTHDSSPGFQPFGFAGGLYDGDTGLVRFGARDYDPQSGRWTARDPIGFVGGQLNLYVYANNDPVSRIDPTGLDDLEELDRLLKKRNERVRQAAKDITVNCTNPLMFAPMFMPGQDPGKTFEFGLDFLVDLGLAGDDLNDWVGPFYKAAEAAERAPAEVKQELANERALKEAYRQNQELLRVLNSLGLYLPGQTPPGGDTTP